MNSDRACMVQRYVSALGWHVLLLAPESKLPLRCKAEGGRGVYDATNDADQLMAALRAAPEANVGVACGVPSNIIALDVDPRNGGALSIRALSAKGHAFPPSPRARTGNGGWHLLFQHEAGVGTSKDRLGRGVDVRSTGSYIVAAPSRIARSQDGPGGSYSWEVSPFELAVPRMPSWLTELLNPPRRVLPKFEPDARSGDVGHLARFVAASREGERNNRLHWAACRASEAVARHLVSESSVESILLRAAMSVGLSADAAVRTIRSGLKTKGT